MKIPAAELDALDAGAPQCQAVRPGTLGYQCCLRPEGHRGQHVSQDSNAWRGVK
jgi:hypothetical protein